MKKSNKAILIFLVSIVANMLIFEQPVFADVAQPTDSLKEPNMLILFGVCITIIVGITIYFIISAKKNK